MTAELTPEQEKYLESIPEEDRGAYRKKLLEQIEYLPSIQASLDELYNEGWVDLGPWGDYFSDDGSMFEVTDSEGQRLWFRYGMVFGQDGVSGHGVWVHYQEWNGYSKMQGPVLMSEPAFEELISYYRYCKRRGKWWYRLWMKAKRLMGLS